MLYNSKTTKTKYLLILILVFSVCTVFSQSPAFTNFRTKDGLPHDITYGLLQDSNGFIWIGTDDGLTRYDGITFKNYGYKNGLKSNYVIDVLELEKNKLAIATWGSGLHYLKNDSIFKPSISSDSNTKISILEKLKENIIFGNTNLGFNLYKNNTTQRYRVVKNKDNIFLCNVNKLGCKKNNLVNGNSVIEESLYFHAPQKKNTQTLKGVYKLVNENLVPVFTYLNKKKVYTIYKDESLFYFGLSNSIIVGTPTSFKKSIDLPLADNSKIISLKKNNSILYFIALNSLNSNRELYKYNLNSKKLTSISKTLNIDKMISDFIFDRDGNLWITTYGKGLYVYYNTENIFLGKESFSNASFRSGFPLGKSIFLLATNSIYRLDTDNNKITEKKFPFETEAFLFDKNKNAMYVFSFFDFENKKLNASKEFGFNIHFSGYKEVSMSYENNKYSVFYDNYTLNIYEKGVLLKTINCPFLLKKVLIKNDNIYIFSFDKKLYSNNLKTIDTDINLFKNEQIKGAKINDFIISDENNLLLATDKGLYDVKKQKVKHYTMSNGLISNHINTLVRDKHDILWLGTQRGLNILKNNSFYSIGEEKGQRSSYITKVFIHDNYVYATGNEGVFKYENTNPFKPQELLPLNIIKKNNTFKLIPIDLTNGKSLRIEYKIDNKKWIETHNTTLNFSTLEQGKHNIVFRYKNNLSNWSTTKPIDFTVFYPWYAQSWFYVLLVTLISISIISVSHKLLKRSTEKNEELKRIIEERKKLKETLATTRKNLAQDFHDELGNKLASITMLTNLLMIKNPEKNDNYTKFERIKEDSNYLYSGMKDFIWSLNNESDNLNEVLLYLIEFGKNLFANTEIEFYVESQLQVSPITLPYYWSKQLIFIFKEAMTNVLKHSKATIVLFSFNVVDNELTITLMDNGKGFKEKELNRLNGVLNMKGRAKKIGSVLTIKSENKKTIVTFKGNLTS